MSQQDPSPANGEGIVEELVVRSAAAGFEELLEAHEVEDIEYAVAVAVSTVPNA